MRLFLTEPGEGVKEPPARQLTRARGKRRGDVDRGATSGYVPGVVNSSPQGCRRLPRALACLAAVAALACTPGCGRSSAAATDGEIVEHDAGFALIVPEEWEVRTAEAEVRLVSKRAVADGYPTIHIKAPPASELPDDFPAGSRFSWSGGEGAYAYERWANSLGNGFRLTVHMRAEHISLVITADLWDSGLRMDRRFFRRQVWPVVNSIEIVAPPAE